MIEIKQAPEDYRPAFVSEPCECPKCGGEAITLVRGFAFCGRWPDEEFCGVVNLDPIDEPSQAETAVLAALARECFIEDTKRGDRGGGSEGSKARQRSHGSGPTDGVGFWDEREDLWRLVREPMGPRTQVKFRTWNRNKELLKRRAEGRGIPMQDLFDEIFRGYFGKDPHGNWLWACA